MKKILLIAAVSLLFAGCGTLNPNGPYKGDKYLYRTDATIVGTFKILVAFVEWEYNNRETLKQYPEIKKSADFVRINAAAWRDSAIALRDAYKAGPTAKSKKALDASVNVLIEAAEQSTKYMTWTR